ncbi:hypothetical protein MMC07_000217 [Pseudocyphellaria aurata]|nr:hypothetical protein [Pseudocyphellaria aurata]
MKSSAFSVIVSFLLGSYVTASPVLQPLDSAQGRSAVRERSLTEGFHDQPGIPIDVPIGRTPTTPSATVSSVRYGTFKLGAGSSLGNKILPGVEKPCTDCYIVAMQARLESTNGTELFTDSGLWLHHVIFFNRGRIDLTCPRMAGERFYGGGNTRATRRWNNHGRWGYSAREDERWDVVVELMNDGSLALDATVRIDFEWVKANSTEGQKYREVRPIWIALDDFCGDSGVPVKSVTESFTVRTPTWTATVDGPLVDIAAHMHDAGVEMTTYLNGQPICRSVQVYNNSAREQHIVGQGACKDAGRVKTGDQLFAEVTYDPRRHTLVTHNGTPDPVMGSDGVYVGIE